MQFSVKKKGQGLPFETIAIAILVLIVLAIIIFFYFQSSGSLFDSVREHVNATAAATQ